MHFSDYYAHVDQNGESGTASEQSQNYQDPAQDLGSYRNVGQPARHPHAFDKLHTMGHAQYSRISVADHDYAQHQAQDERGERLKAVEEAQGSPICRLHRLQ